MTTLTDTTTHTGSQAGDTPTPTHRPDGFHTVTTSASPGYNAPQKMGRRLWAPMFVLALMGWAVGFGLAITEASTDRTDAARLQDLANLVPAFMFIGFLGVFSAITFAVARILGAFRKGGGEVQETAEAPVETLAMPPTAKLMLALMMMGMMVMIAGIVANFGAAAAFDGITPSDIVDNAAWGAAASGLRRMGVALYLVGIACGLATIIDVLRFQTIRIGEVAAEHGHSHH